MGQTWLFNIRCIISGWYERIHPWFENCRWWNRKIDIHNIRTDSFHKKSGFRRMAINFVVEILIWNLLLDISIFVNRQSMLNFIFVKQEKISLLLHFWWIIFGRDCDSVCMKTYVCGIFSIFWWMNKEHRKWQRKN